MAHRLPDPGRQHGGVSAAHVIAVLAAAAAALLSAGLIRLLHPLLVRYALARPNARSSHRVPTPQGGGIAVLGAALLAGAAAFAVAGVPLDREIAVAVGAAAILGLLGAIDDIRPLSPAGRALVQIACVAALVAVGEGRVLPASVPWPVEWGLLVLAGVWWVNAVNFMDGIDWITAAELVPLTAALALSAAAGHGGSASMLAAASLCGGLAGFVPANRPPARLFLGDVGSLPLGLLTGWLLLRLARGGGGGDLTAALLLPLYYLADATLTLLRRIARRERVWEPHRQHAYQSAVDRGVPVQRVVGRILALNLALAALAGAALWWPSIAVQGLALAAGAALVLSTVKALAGPDRQR